MGRCRVPKEWKLYYRNAGGEWTPVEGVKDYPTKKGVANRVEFTPVETKALKLEVTLPDDNASGIFEWQVE